jgi:predicted enzyme related to lactoylglutathione lyase
MAHAISWFEIPVEDLERAMKFYGTVLETDLQKMDMGTSIMAFLPSSQDGVGGAIVHVHDKTLGYKPAHSGSVVYLNGGDDLSTPLSRVEAAGGKVIMPKTDIGQGFGYFAFFEDTEGNRVGFHSMK